MPVIAPGRAMNRRVTLALSGGALAALLSPAHGQPLEARFGDLLDVLADDETLIAGAGHVEREDLEPQLAVATGTSNGRKSKAPIADDAVKLIILFEVSSRPVYERKYQSPIWPGGSSGITIGIGNDIGYVTQSRLKADWSAYLAQADLSLLGAACGLKGPRANAAKAEFSSFTLPWEPAYQEFRVETLPRYVGDVEDSVANADLLSPASLGALVSLAYNRGGSFRLAGDRYKEMRAIGDHMKAKDFDKIPDEILSMQRLWNPETQRGLITRRRLEAKLFALGLQA